MNQSIDGEEQNPNEPQEENKNVGEDGEEAEENKTPAEEDIVEVQNKKTYPQYQWNSKCARYLAYAVDGGIFCS